MGLVCEFHLYEHHSHRGEEGDDRLEEYLL